MDKSESAGRPAGLGGAPIDDEAPIILRTADGSFIETNGDKNYIDKAVAFYRERHPGSTYLVLEFQVAVDKLDGDRVVEWHKVEGGWSIWRK